MLKRKVLEHHCICGSIPVIAAAPSGGGWPAAVVANSASGGVGAQGSQSQPEP